MCRSRTERDPHHVDRLIRRDTLFHAQPAIELSSNCGSQSASPASSPTNRYSSASLENEKGSPVRPAEGQDDPRAGWAKGRPARMPPPVGASTAALPGPGVVPGAAFRQPTGDRPPVEWLPGRGHQTVVETGWAPSSRSSRSNRVCSSGGGSGGHS